MHNKKLLIILGAISVALIVGIILFAFLKNKSSNIVPGSALQNQSELTGSFAPFSFSYPSSWTGNTITYPGGELFYIKPTNSSATNPLPSLSIEKHPASDAQKLTDKIVSYKLQGYKSQKFTFNGENVQGISGKGPFIPEIDGKKTPFYENMFVYPYSGSIYFVDYKYEGSSANPDMEQLFQKVLSSVKTQ